LNNRPTNILHIAYFCEMQHKKIKTLVQAKHIEKGIERYNGQANKTIQNHIENIGWNYEAYLFEDRRVMLVYPDKSFGILYISEEALYQDMDNDGNKKHNSLDNL
jgi:hypothetical protein